MEFPKSRTYNNLLATLSGELQAGSRYDVFGAKAREDGFMEIGRVFDETAGNEREHAEIVMRLLNQGEMPDTKANLRAAITGENKEWTDLYIQFAKEANNEGFYGVGKMFMRLAAVEKNHEERFAQYLHRLDKDMLFCQPGERRWMCSNCGYTITSKCAPLTCPLCGYPQGYFHVKEN